MTTRVLERPVWDALAGHQTAFSTGDELARRFAPDIGPLASARDDSPESLRALAELVQEDGTLLLLQADDIVFPPDTVAVSTADGVQMIGSRVLPSDGEPMDPRIVRLTDADTPAMVELALMTKPGPFAARTPSLGQFWGVKDHGVLIAMAGERMKHAGYTELSGVCTHPDARGRGLARALSAWVASRIASTGDTPYLHAYASNTVAIELYRSLGFDVHRSMHVATIARA
jgi:predicted GNAT family acetyltransferase